MSKKKKCPECPAGEKWAVPYADFLSLLLALFIALYAISAQNTEKVKALKTEFIKIFDYAPKPEQAQPVLPIPPAPPETMEQDNPQEQENSSAETISQEVKDSQSNIVDQGGVLEQIAEGVVLKLPTAIYFNPSESALEDQDSQLFLKRITQLIRKLPANIKIDVRGFANNADLQNTPYKNDYELAAARAMGVMDYLIQNGISPQKIFFSSQGHYVAGKYKNKAERIQKSNKVEIYFLVREDQSQNIQEIIKKATDS